MTREGSDLHQKRRPHDRDRTARTIRGRTPRSRSDRTAITKRSSRDRASCLVESPPRSSYDSCWSINTTIDARSWPDRGAIVLLFEVKLKRNCKGIVSTHHQIRAELKPRPMPKESLPRPLQISPTTASIGHDLRAKFPFKNRCISLLFDS